MSAVVLLKYWLDRPAEDELVGEDDDGVVSVTVGVTLSNNVATATATVVIRKPRILGSMTRT